MTGRLLASSLELLAAECGVLDGQPTSGWSIINAAEPLSALAGIIAFGLLPVATIIFAFPTDRKDAPGPISDDEKEAQRAARRAALSLLMPALLTLIIASVLFALVAGELDCRRASVTAIPAAALLGLGALAMFVAVAWALRAYVQDFEWVVSGAALACVIVWAVTIAELWFTIVNAVHHLGRTFVFGIDWGWNLAVGVAAVAGCVAIGQWLRRRRPAALLETGAVTDAVKRCLGTLLALFVIYQVAALRSPAEWQSGWLGWLVVVITLVPVAVVLAGIYLLRALPPHGEDSGSAQASQ